MHKIRWLKRSAMASVIYVIRKMAFILVLWLGEQVQDVLQGQGPSRKRPPGKFVMGS